jgi:hypothetical protein
VYQLKENIMLAAIQSTLAIIAAVRQFLPEIMALLGDVETAMPGSPVDAKLSTVTVIIQTAIKGIDTATVDVNAVWPVIQALIAKHYATAAPAAPAAVTGAV